MTKDGIKELMMDGDVITGYLVINAESMEEALVIAQSGPMITRTQIFEMIS